MLLLVQRHGHGVRPHVTSLKTETLIAAAHYGQHGSTADGVC